VDLVAGGGAENDPIPKPWWVELGISISWGQNGEVLFWGWGDSPAKIRRFLMGFHRQWRFDGTLEQHRGISTTKMRDMMGYIIMGYITKLGDLPPTHGHMMSYSSGR